MTVEQALKNVLQFVYKIERMQEIQRENELSSKKNDADFINQEKF